MADSATTINIGFGKGGTTDVYTGTGPFGNIGTQA
jgi:hypothetical protein